MANVLSDERKQQVVALCRLGWPLRRIEDVTGVRRETASAYLKAAGVPVRPPRGWGRRPPANPANEVSTDPGGQPNPANDPSTGSNPANGVSTDLSWPRRPGRAPAASACEPYRELIESALAAGRNAMAIWQDLVDDHGFAAKYAVGRPRAGPTRAGSPAPPPPAPGSAASHRNVVDRFTRECLMIEIAMSITGQRVASVLALLVAMVGKSGSARLDNGPEFISKSSRRVGLRQRRGLAPNPAREADRDELVRRSRAVATRCDKTATSFLAAVHFACLWMWLVG